MGKHLRKMFTAKEVMEIFERYLSRELGVEQALALLRIKRRQFFNLLKSYREKPDSFSLDYMRRNPPHKINEKTEKKILYELKKEAKLIEDKSNPVRDYNYSFVRETLAQKYEVTVSLSTIIRRAKKRGFIKRSDFGHPMTGKF